MLNTLCLNIILKNLNMKKEGPKRSTRSFKHNELPRECLMEITNTSHEFRLPLKRRSSTFRNYQPFQSFPNEILIYLFGFLVPSDLVKTMQLVCKDWHYLANSPSL